jgi:hypothetical protein
MTTLGVVLLVLVLVLVLHHERSDDLFPRFGTQFVHASSMLDRSSIVKYCFEEGK